MNLSNNIIKFNCDIGWYAVFAQEYFSYITLITELKFNTLRGLTRYLIYNNAVHNSPSFVILGF